MKIKVYLLNSFAKTAGGGNLAGVVLDADSLSDSEMLSIARKVGFSETAFVQKSDKADFKVRFFTPAKEIDICGHATIATYSLLAKKGLAKPGKYKQETRAGVLGIEIKKDLVFMDLALPKFFEEINKKEIADCLNLDEEQLSAELPSQIVSAGLRDIIVPIKDIKSLEMFEPDFKRITELSKKYDVMGLHVFTLETKNNSTAHCRNFAPLYGIPEESATGTSSGILGCYLYKHKVAVDYKNLIFEQGYTMNKPSEIRVRLKTKGKTIQEVQVGGTASLEGEKEVTV
ncbi:MAG: PhzF family phenazine biosynthesis protein [archaeon]